MTISRRSSARLVSACKRALRIAMSARISGDPADIYQCGLSEGIQRVPKSVVGAGSTTGWGQALALYAQLADAFLLSLRGASAFDAMLPWMKAVPLHQQIVVASGARLLPWSLKACQSRSPNCSSASTRSQKTKRFASWAQKNHGR